MNKKGHLDHTTPSIGRLSIPTNAYYNTKYYISIEMLLRQNCARKQGFVQQPRRSQSWTES